MYKKYGYIVLFFLLFVSCKKENLSKPDRLISKEKMKDIIYDMVIFQAAWSLEQDQLKKNKVYSQQFIYKKHDIDSLQYQESTRYYAAHYEVIKGIYEEVQKKIEDLKAATEKEIENTPIEYLKEEIEDIETLENIRE